MQPSELEEALRGAHDACDVALERVGRAAAALLHPHDVETHKRLWEEYQATTTEYSRQVQKLAILTRQLLPAVTMEARDAAA
jgi:hypothetical protein